MQSCSKYEKLEEPSLSILVITTETALLEKDALDGSA